MKKLFKILFLVVVVVFAVSCSNNKNGNGKTINVAASPVPHGEILNQIKDLMSEKGYELNIVEFSDYVQPNLAVDNGQMDANYFQHKPYLDDFNKERGTKLVSVGNVHYEPFGIYRGTKNSLNNLTSGDKIAVPNDVTNEARALLLLESAGLIKLKQGAGLTATKLDIVENNLNLDIVEIESAQIPRVLDSVAVACMNGNYAIEAGFTVNEALFIEPDTSDAAKQYANIICVSEKNKNAQFAKDLMECLKSEKVKNFINERYNKSVIPID